METNFSREYVATKSEAAAGLYDYVFAVIRYYELYQQIQGSRAVQEVEESKNEFTTTEKTILR